MWRGTGEEPTKSNSRMRAPALAGVATVRGARGAPGPTPMRARGTMNEPTSVPAPLAILAEVSSDAGRDLRGEQVLCRRHRYDNSLLSYKSRLAISRAAG